MAGLPEHRLALLEEVFGYFDTDGNGRMRTADLGRALRCLGCYLSLANAAIIAQEVDVDGAGEIGFDDFVVVVQRQQELTQPPPHLEEAAAAFVTDDEGRIEIAQFKQIMTSLAEPLSEAEADELIRDLAQPGDDAIAMADLVALLHGQQKFRAF